MGFILPIIALVMALAVIGFDLASLAFFGGAIGIGIGLGLQKIIGNFLAGFTLLADRSIKPGDVIEIGDTFGAITDMKSRYVSIRTRDGKEHLVPNATFMDEGVINWSHNDKVVCCYASMGVGYGTKDMHKVRKLVEAAALDTPRVLARPAPKCNMTEFGDSSVNFELRFWINDPMNGVSNVRSDILFRVWEAFAENGIEIPFPQRDLHIRSSAVAFGTGYREAAE
nr:mechanosensitive ion channel domain-containing protein [Parvularcula dongshanensis]